MENTILETIQTISYIFSRHGKPICPFDVSFRETQLKTEMESLVIQEYIMIFSDYLQEYKDENGKEHEYTRYLVVCLDAFSEIYGDDILPSKPKKTKKSA